MKIYVTHSFNKKQTWVVIVTIQVLTAVIATVFTWYGKDVSQLYLISGSLCTGLGLNTKASYAHE